MYSRAYGVIEALAPLHVGASAGEESGNLNLIFRDQFTQTGIVPGSSIRGRLRAEMRQAGEQDEQEWYGRGTDAGRTDGMSESAVKFEYASLIWLPVFCPGQPIVWVSCPRLLARYQRIAGMQGELPRPYTGSKDLQGIDGKDVLFFNLGFLTLKHKEDLSAWFPERRARPAVVVEDSDMAVIHDMALYRQSRVKLHDEVKVVDGGAFFNVEALPEETLLVFPVAIKPTTNGKTWQPFSDGMSAEIYLGGLESIGFGHCRVTIYGV